MEIYHPAVGENSTAVTSPMRYEVPSCRNAPPAASHGFHADHRRHEAWLLQNGATGKWRQLTRSIVCDGTVIYRGRTA